MHAASPMNIGILMLLILVVLLDQCHGFNNCRKLMTTSKMPSISRGLKSSENDNVGYGPIGSLLRQGPVPFFIRLVKVLL